MPAKTKDKHYKLTEIENNVVNLILEDCFKQLKQVLRIETKLITRIVLHKLIDLECV